MGGFSKILAFGLQFIPGVGPMLSMATGAVTTFFKPAVPIAEAVAADGEGAVKTVMGNAVLRELILVAVIVLLFLHGRHLKAQITDPATRKTWRSEAASLLGSYNQERASFLAVNGALTDQNGRLRALKALSAAKLVQAGPLAAAAQADLRRGLQSQQTILAADRGQDACARAQSIDAAFLEQLR